MPQCHLRIGRLNGPFPLFPEFSGKVVHEGEITHAGVLECGMKSGKASVGLYAQLADGTVIFSQTSVEILRAIVAAADGLQKHSSSRNN